MRQTNGIDFCGVGRGARNLFALESARHDSGRGQCAVLCHASANCGIDWHISKSLVHRDMSGVPWPELGYSVAAWNAIDGAKSVSFHVKPGQYTADRIFPNSLELQLPKRTPDTTGIVNTPILRKVLLSVVSAWEPSWALITSASYNERFHLSEKPFPLFRSGWMTYLSRPSARRISPPGSAIVEGTRDDGILLLATNETFTAENPRHIAVADEIQRSLVPIQDEGERWRQAHER